MLDTAKIKDLFSFMTDLSGEELERCAPLLKMAGARIEGRLRPQSQSLSTEDAERLHLAAAGEAYLDYRLMRGGSLGGGESLRIGDISVSGSAGHSLEGDREIRDHFLARAADLLLPLSPLPLEQIP